MSLTPSPVWWAPSQYWEGDDGSWSSFALRIGKPEQVVRLLPSTAGRVTSVIIPQGCPSNTTIPDCVDSRGGTFLYNQSETWSSRGFYSLGLEGNLGYSNSGEDSLYGFDTVSLGCSDTSSNISIQNHLVAGLTTSDFELGMFGLGEEPWNFSDFGNPYPSYLSTMKANNLIPSKSWSYTAGAPYRLKGIFGSLTFGGYDLSRFVPHNITFSMAGDISRDLVVGLQAITATSLTRSNIALLTSPINTFIDSTVPWIILPTEACSRFESELGLSRDLSTGLYLVSDEMHNNLTDSRWNFTFEISDSTAGGPTVEIVFPYASFDLTAKYPFAENTTRYFPLLPATNSSQYTLGRAFLQEAYLITNYEASNFSVSPCKFDDSLRQNIVAIPSTTPLGLSTSHKRIRDTAAIGVTIGVVLLLLLSFLIFILKKHNRKRYKDSFSSTKAPKSPETPPIQESVQEMEQNSLARFREIADTGIVELPQLHSSVVHCSYCTVHPSRSSCFGGASGSPASRRLPAASHIFAATTMHNNSAMTKNKAADPHPQFCDELVSSPATLLRSLPYPQYDPRYSIELIMPSPSSSLPPSLPNPPPLPAGRAAKTARSSFASQISQLLEMYIHQDNKHVKKTGGRILEKQQQQNPRPLGNYF